MGESREGTVVRVLQEEDDSFRGTGYDSGGIMLRGTNITLKNLTFQAGTRQMNGFTAAVGVHDGNVGGSAFSPMIENCTLTRAAAAAMRFFLIARPLWSPAVRLPVFCRQLSFTVIIFPLQTVQSAIMSFMIVFMPFMAIMAERLRIAIISGNTITVADDRFAVIAILDQNNTGAVRLSLEGNTFSRTIVGATSMRKDGDVKQGSMEDLKDANTFADYSFIVDAYLVHGG